MADAFPSFIATCKAPGVYIGATGYVVDLSVDTSPNQIILGGTEPRYGNSTVQIDAKGHNPVDDEAYTKEQLANYAFVLKACSYSIQDPEAKTTVRNLAVAVAKMSDAVPAPAPKPSKKPATTAAQLRAESDSARAPQIMNHNIGDLLR